MFAKIFAQILDSSIADDPAVRHFFMDLLVLADCQGVVDMTPASIAARTRLAQPDVETWLLRLEAADPESRTPDSNGARIVRLDASRTWGWKIVNWQKYREIATSEMLRMTEADRKRAYRSRFPSGTSPGHVRDMSGTCPGQKPPFPHSPIPCTEAEAGESGTCPGQVRDKSPPVSEKEGEGTKGKLAPWERIELTKQLKDIDDQIKFLGSDCMNDGERARRRELKARLAQVRNALGWL